MARPKAMKTAIREIPQEAIQEKTPPNNEDIIDNVSDVELDIEAKAPKKRGRPKGSANKDASKDTITNVPKDTKKPRKKRVSKKKEITTESLKMSIMGTHAMLAIYTPSAMISEPNATAMALSMKQVIDEYDMAWLAHYFPIFALAGTIAFCEMPTIKAVKAEHERRVEMKKAGGTNNPPSKFKPTSHMIPIREDMTNE